MDIGKKIGIKKRMMSCLSYINFVEFLNYKIKALNSVELRS